MVVLKAVLLAVADRRMAGRVVGSAVLFSFSLVYLSFSSLLLSFLLFSALSPGSSISPSRSLSFSRLCTLYLSLSRVVSASLFFLPFLCIYRRTTGEGRGWGGYCVVAPPPSLQQIESRQVGVYGRHLIEQKEERSLVKSGEENLLLPLPRV